MGIYTYIVSHLRRNETSLLGFPGRPGDNITVAGDKIHSFLFYPMCFKGEKTTYFMHSVVGRI
jgi:hypothetical protein